MGIRMEGKGWGSKTVVIDREFGPTTKEVYSAIENVVKELYILIWSVFCEGFFVVNIWCEILSCTSPFANVWLGNASATTTVIDSKNGSVPKSPGKVLKRTVTEDLMTTFSSPAAWLLVIALIVTWSAVAVVMFDLVDYKNLSGKVHEVWPLHEKKQCFLQLEFCFSSPHKKSILLQTCLKATEGQFPSSPFLLFFVCFPQDFKGSLIWRADQKLNTVVPWG